MIAVQAGSVLEHCIWGVIFSGERESVAPAKLTLKYFRKLRTLPPPAPEFPQKYPTHIDTHWFAQHELARITATFVLCGDRTISKMLIDDAFEARISERQRDANAA
jgi:hypothetical protein